MRVLVTAGGTEEPVDGVRRLTNTSTGATGGVLARSFAEHGAKVLLLHAERAPLASIAVERDTFVTFADLENALRRHLGSDDWDAVIHLAAVSDYTVSSVEVDGSPVPHGDQGKIGSGHEVVIRLSPNPKLIDSLKRWSRNKAILVIGFKLTNSPDPAARTTHVRALLDRSTVDFVVHNDLGDLTAAHHPAEIWGRRGALVQTATKEELAEALWALLTTLHAPESFADLLAGKFPEVNP
jgi:phosphopantothenoylcysteine decarboxylase/phosphopantothenate--cysteine ligase